VGGDKVTTHMTRHPRLQRRETCTGTEMGTDADCTSHTHTHTHGTTATNSRQSDDAMAKGHSTQGSKRHDARGARANTPDTVGMVGDVTAD
jgi:hypothetical protein